MNETIKDKKLYPVVPLNDYSKIPRIKWSDKDNWIATEEELEKQQGHTGFFLLTGKVSDVMVLDIDVNHGDGSVDGIKTFQNLIKDLPVDDIKQIKNTLAVKTVNGGLHYYFKYKEGLKNKSDYAPGVDIRTDGGIVVAPGSKVKANDNKVKQYKSNNKDIQAIPESLFNKLIDLDKPVTNLVEIKNTGGKKEILGKKTHSFKNGEGQYKQKKYYQPIKEGEGRNDVLVSWLGYMIKYFPTAREEATILPLAHTYNQSWFAPPLPVEEVEKTVISTLRYTLPKYCDEKGNIDIWALVQHIIKEQPCYTKGNLWYMYDEEKGFYNHLEMKEIQKMFFKYPLNSKEKTVTKSKNFAELLLIESEDAKDVQDEKRYINCKNGIVDIEENKLLPHDPKYKLELQFQANYKEDWKDDFETSEFKKFLDSTVGAGSLDTIQEALGLMLSPHSREVQQCFIYKGEGSNGKSVLFDIQEALINDNKFICSIGLGDFGGDFTVSVAEGKHANIVRDDELSGQTVNKAFKSMICGEPVLVNRKHKDLLRLGFNMTHFFGLNRLPGTADKSRGFFRRPVIIPFNNSFGTEEEVRKGLRDKVKDPLIAERIIKNELDIVFMWAYEGLQRLKNNKWKITVSEESEEEMQEYREEIDSAYAFFNQHIEITKGKGHKLPVDTVYSNYVNWCSYNNITYMNKTQFGRQITSYGVKRGKSGNTRLYKDIQLVNFDEYDDFLK